MVLLGLEIVRGLVGVHERSDGEDDKHEGEAVGEKRLVGRRGRILVVKLRVDLGVERLRRYRSVPGSKGMRRCGEE